MCTRTAGCTNFANPLKGGSCNACYGRCTSTEGCPSFSNPAYGGSSRGCHEVGGRWWELSRSVDGPSRAPAIRADPAKPAPVTVHRDKKFRLGCEHLPSAPPLPLPFSTDSANALRLRIGSHDFAVCESSAALGAEARLQGSFFEALLRTGAQSLGSFCIHRGGLMLWPGSRRGDGERASTLCADGHIRGCACASAVCG